MGLNEGQDLEEESWRSELRPDEGRAVDASVSTWRGARVTEWEPVLSED